jgi:hypothetical protein
MPSKKKTKTKKKSSNFLYNINILIPFESSLDFGAPASTPLQQRQAVRCNLYSVALHKRFPLPSFMRIHDNENLQV